MEIKIKRKTEENEEKTYEVKYKERYILVRFSEGVVSFESIDEEPLNVSGHETHKIEKVIRLQKGENMPKRRTKE